MLRFLSILIFGCCFLAEAQVSSNWFQKGSAIALDNTSSFDMSFSGGGNSIALVGASSSDAHAKVYSLQEAYNLTVNINGSGSVNITSGSYPSGTNIVLAVNPDSEEWLFTGWSGDFVGDHTTSNATITITSNMIITANFSLDADEDGLSNLYELSTSLSDPYNIDTDGDGLSDYEEISGSEYEFIEGAFSWSQARDDAVSRGGHLATVTSTNEWNNILSLLDSVVTSRTQTSFHIWIGGTDENVEGQWEWITGEPWTVDFWHGGEPNDDTTPQKPDGENYTAINQGVYGMIRMTQL